MLNFIGLERDLSDGSYIATDRMCRSVSFSLLGTMEFGNCAARQCILAFELADGSLAGHPTVVGIYFLWVAREMASAEGGEDPAFLREEEKVKKTTQI